MQNLVDNRYRLSDRLGSGGMAEVYMAHDDVLDRDVALKVLSSRYSDDEEFVERFRREAQSAAALSHPNIVSIFDRGESEDGTYYIAMEYLSGGTLKDRIVKRGALPARTAAAVALQIAEALKAAHDSGVIHRDIKPHNILITESGDIKVTDFGIARAASSSTMTRTGSILGTAHYLSPEQAMGEPVGPSSDIYSLGIVLYEMLTGELPYDADTPIGIAMKHVNGHVREPIELDPSIPQGINDITVKMLARNPEDRYQDTEQLIEDLGRASKGFEPSGATTRQMTRRMAPVATAGAAGAGARSASSRPKKPRRFAPLLLALLALVLLAGLAWAGYGALRGGEPGAMTQVPDLTGMTLEEARSQVTNFEVVRGGEENSEQPESTILSQNPSGGQAEENSEIRATVASGQNEIPPVEGSPQQEAEAALSDAGFETTVTQGEGAAAQTGQVVGQSPGGGATADVGSTVEITVGSGPGLVQVPDLYSSTPDEAAAMLEDAGLELGGQDSAYSNEVAEGGIIAQSPTAGESVESGSVVGITVSDGVEELPVPDVTGQDIGTAQQNVWNAGFAYTPVEIESDEPAGTVVSTDPAGGTMLDPWAQKVTINYSAGPPPEPAPDPGVQQPAPRQNGSGPEAGQNREAQQRAREAQQRQREKAREARQRAQEKAREARQEAQQEARDG
ncbi:MAG: Stk1 family PASTA domain-containing Ser/Thr kinase [Rubrobacteraceae bacterium]